MLFALRNLHKSYGKQVVFENLNIDFSTCGFYVLRGASGSGKTTLLTILAGYESFDKGERCIASGVQIASIFQNFELIDSISVKENIELYEQLHHCVCEHKEAILKQLGLLDLLEHYPSECSQGQKQRVGIARALLMNPSVILCDEPTESLDEENKQKVMDLLVMLSKTKVVIVATHELDLLNAYQPCIYTLENHQLYGEAPLDKEQVYVKDIPPISKVYVKNIMKNILYKKTRMQFMCVILFTLCLLLLAQYHQTMFTPSTTLHALNANMMYATSNDDEVHKEDLQQLTRNPEVILPMDEVRIKGKDYRMQVVPYLKNEKDLKIQGDTSLSGMNILINQNVAALLAQAYACSTEELLHRTLDLSYSIQHTKYPLTFTIIGILQEKDAGALYQIYYDKEDVLQIIHQQDTHQYQQIIQYSTSFMFPVEDKAITLENYRDMKDRMHMFTLYNAILENRQTIVSEMAIFRIVFQVLIVLVYIVSMFYMVYDMYKEWRKQVVNLVILYACQVNVKLIKMTYLEIKGKMLFTCYGILLLEIMGYMLLTHPANKQLLYMLFLITSFFLVLNVVLYQCASSLKETQLATYLKDDKDQK